jgi:thiol-disulfide isomerase/thioredoxin
MRQPTRRERRTASAQPRRNPWVTFLPVVIAILVVAVIVVYATHQSAKLPSAAVEQNAVPQPGPPRTVGSRAPQFSVQTPLGPISNATFAGRPYFLELFATWCPHCQRMTAVLKKLRTAFPDERLGMVSISASPIGSTSTVDNPVPESQADVDAFDQAFGVTWLAAFDPNLSAAQVWGLNGFPTMFFVNARGVIVYQHSGEAPLSALLAAAKKAGA